MVWQLQIVNRMKLTIAVQLGLVYAEGWLPCM
jgi:hypothetical protein